MSSEAEARRTYLIAMRKGLGLTQAEMAAALGMGVRAFSDIETGKSECRPIHIMAAERLTLRLAVERDSADLLAAPVLADLRALARHLAAG